MVLMMGELSSSSSSNHFPAFNSIRYLFVVSQLFFCPFFRRGDVLFPLLVESQFLVCVRVKFLICFGDRYLSIYVPLSLRLGCRPLVRGVEGTKNDQPHALLSHLER